MEPDPKPESPEEPAPPAPEPTAPEVPPPVPEPAAPPPGPPGEPGAPAPPAEGTPDAATEAAPAEKPKKEPRKPKKRPVYEMKLFERYDLKEVVVHDAGLAKYINLDPIVIPHTGGRWAAKPFGKMKTNVVERPINGMRGR